MPGEKGFLSLLVVLLVAGTAVYLPSSGAGGGSSASSARGAAPQDQKNASGQNAPETYQDAVSLIAAHYGVASDVDALARDADYPRVAGRLQPLADAGRFSVRFLVATVPDPIDSNARWQFDPTYDSIQRAVSANGYALDRFYIPDWDPAKNPDTDKTVGAMHERVPGVVLFRRQAGDETQFLAVLLAFETATGGIHEASLRRALWTAAEGSYWQCPREHDVLPDGYPVLPSCSDMTIPVLGPIFSGSIPSLGNAIASVSHAFTQPLFFRVVSGEATNTGNETTLRAASSPARMSYSTTVLSDDEVLDALGPVLQRRVGHHRRAVLIEANTAYGAALSRRLTPGTSMCPEGCTVLPFPLHISRLRSIVNANPPANAASPIRRAPPLSLDEPVAPTDQVPSMAPQLTSSSTDVAMTQILGTIQREQLTVIGLFATDARDKLFLAQQISQRSPDALLFTTEGDLLFTHTDYVPYTRGMIVAGSYPLFTATQLWRPTASGDFPRQQFASMNAEGIYNAAVALLDYGTDGTPYFPKPIPLLDYRASRSAGANAGPHLWVTVVGRESVWPLDREETTCATCAAYLSTSAGRPLSLYERLLSGSPLLTTEDLPIHPSMTLVVLLLAVEGFATFFAWRRLRAVFREPRGSRPASQREVWNLCCDVALAITQYAILVVINSYRLTLLPYQSNEAGVGVLFTGFAELWAMALLVALTVMAGARASTARVRNITAVAALTAGALWFLLPVVTSHLLESDPTLTLNRGLQIFSGASPFAPAIVILAALCLWPAAQSWRAATPTLASIPPDHKAGGGLDRLASGGFVALSRKAAEAVTEYPLCCLSEHDAWLCVFGGVPALFFVLYAIVDLQTIEGPAFDAFFLAGWLFIQALVIAALDAHFRVWHRTKLLLKAIAAQPITAAFSDVPRELFSNRLPPRRPRLIHLQHAINAHDAMVARLEPVPAIASGSEGAAIMQQAIDEATTTVLPAFKSNGELQSTLDSELGTSKDIAKSTTWPLLLGEIEKVAPALKSRWQKRPARLDSAVPPKRDDATWQDSAESFIAISMAVMIRELSARAVRGMYLLFAALLALVVYETSFHAYPRGVMLVVTWTYVAIGVGTALATVVSAERDVVLSHLAGTTPGKIQWDSAFIARTIIPLLFALFTLLATQFPAAGDLLLRWLRPVQSAIP